MFEYYNIGDIMGTFTWSCARTYNIFRLSWTVLRTSINVARRVVKKWSVSITPFLLHSLFLSFALPLSFWNTRSLSFFLIFSLSLFRCLSCTHTHRFMWSFIGWRDGYWEVRREVWDANLNFLISPVFEGQISSKTIIQTSRKHPLWHCLSFLSFLGFEDPT